MPQPRLALSRGALDRASERRAEPGLVKSLLGSATTLVLPVRFSAGQVHAPVLEVDGEARLATVPAADWSGPEPYVFLGVDGAGTAYLTVKLDDGRSGQPADSAVFEQSVPGVPAGAAWVGLREVGALLDDLGAGLLTSAAAILGWHGTHPRCSRCGTATDVSSAGWERHCPNCGADHYPRTDGAVIMAITDPQGRLLLGRQTVWPPARYSVLAGFVEPGESLEAAVRREVLEESGIVVGEVSYFGSQPWPFPSSLMLGFHGVATTSEITVDGEELAEASWWSKDDLLAGMAAGTLILPGPVSIARRLIEDWFGGPLEDGVASWR